jgi:hypothetical protein
MTSLTLQLFHNLLSKRYLICPPFRGKPNSLGFSRVFTQAGMTIRKARRQERAKAPDSKFHAPPKTTMYIFITREYDSSDLKENGTIPF